MGPALAGHHLKDIAGADIALGGFHRLFIALFGEIRARRGAVAGLAHGAGGLGQGAFQIAQRVHHPLGRLGIGCAGRLPLGHPSGADDGNFALHTIQHRHHRGAQHQGIGQAQRIGRNIGQAFHQADHVIAQIAKKPGTGGRQAIGQGDAAFGNERAQVVQRVAGLGCEIIRVKAGIAVQMAGFAMAFPHQIGLEPDNRIAPAHLAAGDGFQHKGIFGRARQFQHQRNGRIQISRQTRIDNLVFALVIGGCELGKAGCQIQFRCFR